MSKPPQYFSRLPAAMSRTYRNVEHVQKLEGSKHGEMVNEMLRANKALERTDHHEASAQPTHGMMYLN